MSFDNRQTDNTFLLHAQSAARILPCMDVTNTKAQLKAVTARLLALRAELDDAYTAKLGQAAKSSVRQAIADAENEFDRLTAQ